MSFANGSVTFTRLRTTGDLPKSCDTTTLATLVDNAFVEQTVRSEKEIEAGFIAGEHLNDIQFSYEKNGYGVAGQSILFAMRIDTHRVPAEIKKTFYAQKLAAMAAGNPSGFASNAQRREARDEAEREVATHVAAGDYRKPKMVQLLWHLPSETLYVGTGSEKTVELIARCMREAFNIECYSKSPGRIAAEAYPLEVDEARPLAYGRPAAMNAESVSAPMIPWLATAADTRDWLGNEFALWLWYLVEVDSGLIGDIAVMFEKSIDLQCAWGTGKQSSRGDAPTKTIEARDALRSGMLPRKAGLLLSDGENQWGLALQFDRLAFTSVKLPEVPEAETMRDLIDARISSVIKLSSVVDGLFKKFVAMRLATGWPAISELIKEWVRKAPGEKLVGPSIAREFLERTAPKNYRTGVSGGASVSEA